MTGIRHGAPGAAGEPAQIGREMPFRSWEPVAMVAAIGRRGGLFTEVEWRRGMLRYHIGEKLSLTFRPDEVAWTSFWQDLEEVGFWSWRRSYHADGVTGRVWEVDIRHRGRRVRAEGEEVFPPCFGRFCLALSALLGGAEFG